MNSDETMVQAQAMQNGIASLERSHSRLTQTLEALTGELNSSLASWDGEAKNVYYDAQKRWNAASEHMASVVAKMKLVMTEITAGYATTERNIQNRFGGSL